MALYKALTDILFEVGDMVKEKIGTFRQPLKKGRTGVIYVPADLTIDSAFPFKDGEKVNIKIDGERLIVEKVEKDGE